MKATISKGLGLGIIAGSVTGKNLVHFLKAFQMILDKCLPIKILLLGKVLQ